ncbi:hypothetical protein [Achromobacter phage tuull]|nr:hypothetical protein [Achromobacter phage tuull]
MISQLRCTPFGASTSTWSILSSMNRAKAISIMALVLPVRICQRSARLGSLRRSNSSA